MIETASGKRGYWKNTRIAGGRTQAEISSPLRLGLGASGGLRSEAALSTRPESLYRERHLNPA